MAPKKRYCAAKGCSTYKVSGDGQSMCGFPLDEARQKLWGQASGNVDLLGLTRLQIHQNFQLCPRHFEPHMFWDKFRTKLRPGFAVPTIFDHPPLTDEQMLRFGVPGNVFFFNGEVSMEVDVADVVDVDEPPPLQSSVPEQPVTPGSMYIIYYEAFTSYWEVTYIYHFCREEVQSRAGGVSNKDR
ncbi:hypothetical protein FOCC_FOCC000312, partial [Frankliniella occidentalis]